MDRMDQVRGVAEESAVPTAEAILDLFIEGIAKR